MSFTTINDVIYLDPQLFTTTTGDNDNVPLSSSSLQVDCTSDNDAVTGLIPPLDKSGCTVWVTNASAANTLLIPNNDTGSTDGFRFILGGGSTMLTLEPGQSQQFTFKQGVGWVALQRGIFS